MNAKELIENGGTDDNITAFLLTEQKDSASELLNDLGLLTILKLLEIGEVKVAEAFMQKEDALNIKMAADAQDNFIQISENLDKLEDALVIGMN